MKFMTFITTVLFFKMVPQVEDSVRKKRPSCRRPEQDDDIPASSRGAAPQLPLISDPGSGSKERYFL